MVIPKMITSIIVAVSENWVIGKDNDLIWHLPNDMKFFKEKTTGHHVITGRKNYISIPKKYRPLTNRTNIVLSRKDNFNEEGCVIMHSLEEAVHFAHEHKETEVFIIGGGQIYKEALDKKLVDRMYVTHVENSFDGDTFFPSIDTATWKKTTETRNTRDEKHLFPYRFATYEKIE